jgi:hypothetical protein
MHTVLCAAPISLAGQLESRLADASVEIWAALSLVRFGSPTQRIFIRSPTPPAKGSEAL